MAEQEKHESFLNKRIVTVGGGTGGFAVNLGLSRYPCIPTAVCTVFDSGGSTGRLRDEFGALPQGDIRRCLLALASRGDDLRALFEYRFQNGNGGGISDHSVGNLLLLAAEKLWGPIEGTRRIAELLKVKGQVLPVSVDDAHLVAELSDGSTIRGESTIDLRSTDDERTIVRVELSPKAFICREAADAIREADIIVLGPGDLYTSLVPNLLVSGFAEAVGHSKAKVVLIMNLMTKWAETRNFSAADFAKTMLTYGIGREQFDAILVNDAAIPADLLARYREHEKAECVTADREELAPFAKQVVFGNFLNAEGLKEKLIRHDRERLARAIMSI